MNTSETLTVADVMGMSQVLDAIVRNAHVRRLMPDGAILEGTVRHLSGPDGGSRPDDVREAHVRVTSDAGWEHYLPLAELARQVQHGEFAIDN